MVYLERSQYESAIVHFSKAVDLIKEYPESKCKKLEFYAINLREAYFRANQPMKYALAMQSTILQEPT